MLVLLIEDDLDLAELVIEYLEAEAIDCDIAYNGVMGLNLLERNCYDVMITDIMMPEMDSFVVAASDGDSNYDKELQSLLESWFPGRDVHLIDVASISAAGGGIHCVTNDQPLLK